MTEKTLFWFCLLVVCFLVQPGRAQVPEPAQCLASGTYNLIRLPENKEDRRCCDECLAEAQCHMAVVTKPLSGPRRCLLVNCLNQGPYSFPRDPSAKISVYPKATIVDERRADGLAEETHLCYRPMDHGEYPPYRWDPFGTGNVPRPKRDESIPNSFFYNVSSERCEGFFFRGSVSNGNLFQTVEECERLCDGVKERRADVMKGAYGLAEETLRCHDIMKYGSCQVGIPKFFYNRTSHRCERFFSGCGSNRNTFDTPEGCQALCSQAYLCYRPMNQGAYPPVRFSPVDIKRDESIPNYFFYNVSNERCEAFFFRGSVSNGNLFRTVEECERLCDGATVSLPTDNVQCHRPSWHPSSNSYKKLFH